MQEGITLPQIKKINDKQNTASFSIFPLYPGYGVTIGNSLRRILYSSLEGAAIYAIKVSGATHEFSTLPDVKEDLIQIILNLKQIRLKIHEGDEAILKLKIEGAKNVTAADIKTPASVEIINPNQYVASLGKKGKLSIELMVNKGLGYVPVESREEGNYPLGIILIDAIYSPIKRISYSIESTRVGKMTNYDKLTIDITTDGAIKPEDALRKAAKILIDQFSLIKDIKTAKKKGHKKAMVTISKEKITDIKSKKIDEAGFSTRTINALVKNKIKTVAGLSRMSEDKLKEMKGLGVKGVDEIQKKLTGWGII